MCHPTANTSSKKPKPADDPSAEPHIDHHNQRNITTIYGGGILVTILVILAIIYLAKRF